MKRLLSLGICVARPIHDYDNATGVAHFNAQYGGQGYSTNYCAQNNSGTEKIVQINEILSFWSLGNGERPKVQETSVLNTQVPILVEKTKSRVGKVL